METTKIILTVILIGSAIGLIACNPVRKSTSKLDGEVKKVAWANKILLHMHPEKVLNYLPDLKDGQIAYLFGMTVEEYRKVRQGYDNEAKETAAKLLANKEFSDLVARLPFKKDETIMILGESTTDTLNSWAVVLEYLLKMKRPGDNIKIINNAIAGQTTTEALKRITMQTKQHPDWVLCFLGSNDCGRYGNESNKTNVSITETLDNLNTIRKIVANEIPNAHFVWFAPLPINEAKTSFFPPFKKMQLYFKNSDLLAIGDSLKLKNEKVIDFRNDFGVPAKSKFLQFDGIHLTLSGQTLIVKHLVNMLTS